MRENEAAEQASPVVGGAADVVDGRRRLDGETGGLSGRRGVDGPSREEARRGLEVEGDRRDAACGDASREYPGRLRVALSLYLHCRIDGGDVESLPFRDLLEVEEPPALRGGKAEGDEDFSLREVELFIAEIEALEGDLPLS